MHPKKSAKQLTGFFKQYKLFGLAVIIAIASLSFDVAGAHRHTYREIAHWLLVEEGLFMTLVIAWQIIQQIRNGIWGVDILAEASVLSGVLFHEYWAAMIIILMLTGGEALEAYAQSRATTELKDLLRRAPQTATILRGRKAVTVSVNQVQKGNKLLIKPGEVVPVDCIILEGDSSLDESSLTGESLPVNKSVGDDLLSGSINLEGSITAKALRAAQDSQYEQIIRLVRSASLSKAPFVRMADRFAVPFTLASFGIAIAAWIISGESKRFLEVLVVATPCPLILGAPVGLISGMSRASKHGIIIKNGAVLEKLANLKTLAFDKTGTLTRGQPNVHKAESLSSKLSDSEVLVLAASAEQHSNHVLSRAIVSAAKDRGLKLRNPRGLEETPGGGVEAMIGHEHVLVGSLAFMKKQKAELPKNLRTDIFKQTVTLVAVNSKVTGVISFIDEPREESAQMLNRLRTIGVNNTLMVTGDSPAVAQKIAKRLGISEVEANCLPSDKVEFIKHLPKKQRPVGFVGDGVNDAPVLTAADVGIALGARGSTAASESAEVVIMLDDIGRVPLVIEIAKRTLLITKQTIFTGIVLSFGLMLLFSSGRFKPAVGAGFQEIVDVTVIINALRAHGGSSRHRARSKTKPAPNVVPAA